MISYGLVLACMCLHVSAHVRAVCLFVVAVVVSCDPSWLLQSDGNL